MTPQWHLYRGLGKTALAIHWAHRVTDRFADGQLYVNLRGFDPARPPTPPEEAIRGILDALHVPAQRVPDGLAAQTALYRSLVDGKRMLVVLDNARDAEQVRPLLPGAPGCMVVVTSRNQLTGLVAAEGAHPLTLDLLSMVEARALLARRLGSARTSAEPEAIDDIIRACARLPLALAIVAARAATYPRLPLASLAAEVRDARGGLDALHGSDPATDVRAVFACSYRALSLGAARLFRLLGLHPGPEVGAATAASLAGEPVAQVREWLAELAGTHLLTERLPGRYAFHDLLRAYATEQARTHDTGADRAAAVHRMLDHYLHAAYRATGLLDPRRDLVALAPARSGVTGVRIDDHAQAVAWLTTEQPALVAAVTQAAEAGLDLLAWQLAWTIVLYLDMLGHWQEWVDTQRIALAAAGRAGDRSARAYSHLYLGRAYLRRRRFEDATVHLRQSLSLVEELGDRVGQANIHHNLCGLREREGRGAEALDHAQRALDLYRELGHETGTARGLNTVGWYHAQLGRYEQALALCQEAVVLNQRTGDQHSEAATWDSLGYIQHHLGDHRQSIACYRRAIDLYREVADRYNEAETLAGLGDVYLAAGEDRSARDAWWQALAILDDIDAPTAGEVRDRLSRLPTRSPG